MLQKSTTKKDRKNGGDNIYVTNHNVNHHLTLPLLSVRDHWAYLYLNHTACLRTTWYRSDACRLKLRSSSWAVVWEQNQWASQVKRPGFKVVSPSSNNVRSIASFTLDRHLLPHQHLSLRVGLTGFRVQTNKRTFKS